MVERSYTVREIDDLRVACENKWVWGLYLGPHSDHCSGTSRSFKEEEKTKCVEEMVRTFMLAGLTAQELFDSETKPHTEGAADA